MTKLAQLTGRAVLEITGEDRVAFLQGLVSNDVTNAAPGHAVWAAFLTPQGKYLADFFILADAGRLLLDTEAAGADGLAQKLARYRLRAKVAIARTDLQVHVAWNGPPPQTGIQAPDPRLPEAGTRILGGDAAANATPADYDRHRLALGLPDGSRDLEPEKSTLLEAGFDELHGVSWEKGCYMGQELTARTKYRGLIKRRLTPVRIDGPTPASGAPILGDADAEAGTMRSANGDRGLALLRISAIRADRLRCGEATLVPEPASWMQWQPMLLAAAER